MDQISPPFSRTHRAIFVARIAFLATLVAGIVFVAARGDFTSRASDKAAITTLGHTRINTASKTYASAPKTSTLTPVCTTDPVVVNNSDSGAGSLRQAIIDACDASTITFNMAMVTSPISLTTAELSINKNLTITGPGVSLLTIQRSTAGGTPNFRIFTIDSGKAVSISQLTITNGKTADGADGATSGSPGGNGGGILNAGTLTLTDVVVTGNFTGNGGNALNPGATNGGPGGDGGGISSSGSLTMTNVTVSSNTTGHGGNGGQGHHGGRGGGIQATGTLTMTQCSLTDNNTGTGGVGSNAGASGGPGGDGGGILAETSTLNLTNLTVNDNNTGNGAGESGSGGKGGGIFIGSGTGTLANSNISNNTTGDGSAGFVGQGGFGGGVFNGGTLTILGSTISGNSTGTSGPNGGSVGGGIDNSGTLTMTNSTVSGNSTGSTGGTGAGLWTVTTATLINCSIVFNDSQAPFGGAGIDQFAHPSSVVNIVNTIVAGNIRAGDPNGPDVDESNYNSQGHNLIGNAGGSTGFSATGDQVGTSAVPLNPRLAPLANNGGPTFTHALLAGSPALDAGSDAPLTTLNGGIDDSTAAINVADASNIPANAGFTILIDTEQMVVTAKASNTLTVTRGTNSTTAAAHSNGTNLLPAFDQRGANFLRRRDAADGDTVATADIGAFEAQASIEDITDKSAAEDTALSFSFNVGDAASITDVSASSDNTTLVPNLPTNISVNGSGSTRTLNISPAPNQFGTSTITVTVTSGSESMSDTFVLTVTAVADTPSVTPATTNEDTQTTSGLVISRNAADGSEVTHFKITGITNGTLFKSDTTTQINNGDFITFGEGNAGLKFTPAANLFSPTTTPFSFDVQGATDASGGGLSPATTATITVNPVGDIPSVAPATTIVNTQTTSGLVINRNVADGTEVTHFKITNITNGTLFKNDGTTQITNNSFITVAEGNAGLKFTPSHNLASPSSTFSFQVQAATSSGGAGLGSAATATITVNCGPTVVTNTNDSGAGSLRDTINTACPGDTITFAAALTSGGPATITLTSGELVIDKNLTVTGPGANLLTIGGNSNSRVFNVQSGIVALSNLAIASGNVAGVNSKGGGVLNNGTLTLTNCNLYGNTATLGAGIYNDGPSLILINSNIGGNGAGQPNNGEGIRHNGGSGVVPNSGTLLMKGGSIVGNTSSGIVIVAAATLAGVNISENTGSGGISISSNFTINILNCLVANNTNSSNGGFGGGGIVNGLSTVNVINTTITGNSTNGTGGGIYNLNGNITLTNSTVTNNRSDADNNGGETGGAIFAGGSVLLKNTIVAGNFRGASPGTTADDIRFTVSAASSFNLIGTGGSGGLSNGVNNNQVGVASAGLGALANNGGSTQTHLLLPGSPAINAGSNALLPTDTFDLDGDSNTAEVLPVDQRSVGFNRVVNTTVDVGAVEVNYSINATAGTPQSAAINTAFATALQATVKESGVTQSGIPVTFTPPVSGPSGAFSGSATVNTNVSGVATAPTFTANGTAGGPYNVVASLAGGSPSANFALTNAKGNQTITFGALSDKTFGDPDFPVSATTDASGLTVSFSASGQCTVSGAGTGTVHLTGAGSCTITAKQPGDSNYNAAADVPRTFSIANAVTSTLVISSLNPSSLSESVTFTATVSSAVSGTPTGTVQFKDGGTNIGSPQTLNGSAQAFVSTTSLTAGSHVITAVYSGDGTYAASTGTLSGGQIVNDAPVISFDQPTYGVNETTGSLTITVNRTGLTGSAVSIDYATDDGGSPADCASTNGLASSRCDFTPVAGTLHFASSETQKTVVIPVNRDSYVEGSELFTINLSNPTGGAILSTPSTTTVMIADDSSGLPPNALDDVDFFVQQHYHDFFSREPDTSGYNFWRNQINSCGSDQACIRLRRINVSAAFFVSVEFQQTGYLVERLYRVAYGSAVGNSTFGGAHTLTVPIVRFNEFLPDTQAIGKGLIVGQPGWETVLENNKQALIDDLVQRSRFTTAYPLTMTPTEYVDALNVNAGGALSQTERDQLIGDLISGAKTRAQVLRAVAEDQDLYNDEFNRAFVLMQYYGYLRRNPNDPPETNLDYTGYDFWLKKLNAFQGNYINAQMVQAFLDSSEYRQRFGPP